MGKLFGSGGSSSTTTETSPWKPAQGALESILGQAGELFDKQGGINAEFIEKEIADLTPEMQQAIKDLVNTQGFKDMATSVGNAIQTGQSTIGQATGGLGALAQQGITSEDLNKMASDLYDSTLVQNQKESLTKDVQAGLASNIQGLNQQASAQGNMGSSRAGVAEGVAVGKAGEAIAQGSAAIENAARQQAYGQALGTLQGNQNTALGALGQMGQLGIGGMNSTSNAMGNLSNIYQQGMNNALTGSSILQQYQQGVLNNKWFNATGQQNAGWNNLNNYLGIAGSIGGMGGTSTSTGKGGGNSGALGGLMSGAGNIISGGAQAGWWSDERFKDELEVVKEAHTRVNQEGVEYPVPTLYRWKWNDLAHAVFADEGFEGVPPEFGVIAQDLEETGFEKFVEYIETDVPGLGGEYRVVNYPALCLYVGLDEMDMSEKGV